MYTEEIWAFKSPRYSRGLVIVELLITKFHCIIMEIELFTKRNLSDQNDDSLENIVVQGQIFVLFLHSLKNYKIKYILNLFFV